MKCASLTPLPGSPNLVAIGNGNRSFPDDREPHAPTVTVLQGRCSSQERRFSPAPAGKDIEDALTRVSDQIGAFTLIIRSNAFCTALACHAVPYFVSTPLAVSFSAIKDGLYPSDAHLRISR